jgi:hypothetical protein
MSDRQSVLILVETGPSAVQCTVVRCRFRTGPVNPRVVKKLAATAPATGNWLPASHWQLVTGRAAAEPEQDQQPKWSDPGRNGGSWEWVLRSVVESGWNTHVMPSQRLE